MLDHREIYRKHASEYDFLVSREDYRRNLPRALGQIRPFDGLDVVELGAGTVRLTCMMAPFAKTILASDISRHMLDVATAKLEKTGLQNWTVAVADNRALPVANRVADLAIVGWSLGYFPSWYEGTWREEVGQALEEMNANVIALEHGVSEMPGMQSMAARLEQVFRGIRATFYCREPEAITVGGMCQQGTAAVAPH
jgi:ubiquinone/menaquinone biosynthesis C-methylase UbiE